MDDMVSRQAAIDVLDVLCQEHRYRIPGKRETYSQYNEAWQDALDRAEGAIFNLPPAHPEQKAEELLPDGTLHFCTDTDLSKVTRVWVSQNGTHYGDLYYADGETERWIPCSERLPEDLEEVNVTWVNHSPEPYYDFVKDKPFTASAVYYGGKWYWYSSVCTDILAEYGKNETDEIDDAIEITAWMPLPEPYREDGE